MSRTVTDGRRVPSPKHGRRTGSGRRAAFPLSPLVSEVVQPGEIRILTMPTEAERKEASGPEKGWNVFRSLGRDAQPGQLSNAAVEHDRYLYGKGQ